jgi:hypothetical protein
VRAAEKLARFAELVLHGEPIGRQEAKRLLRKAGIDPSSKRAYTRWLARRSGGRVKREIGELLGRENGAS